MSIISYLQKKKIIPSRETIIKEQAKRLAKQVCKPEYFIIKLDNLELTNFANEFRDEILVEMAKRYKVLSDEAAKTENALNNIK